MKPGFMSFRNITVIIVCTVINSLVVNGQTIFDNQISTPASGFFQTPDNGFIVQAGNLIIKTDSNGIIKYSGQFSPSPVCCVQTSDGGYSFLSYSSIHQLILYKTDSIFNVTWKRRLQFSCIIGPSYNLDLSALSDGSILISSPNQTNASLSGILLIKLDAQGNIVWNETLRNINYPAQDFGFINTSAINNGGFILACEGFAELVVVKFDSSGAVTWSYNYDDFYNFRPRSIFQSKGSSSIIITGGARCPLCHVNAGGVKPFFLKLDATGNVTAAQKFGVFGGYMYSAYELPDTTLLLSGISIASPVGNKVLLLVKLDQNHDTLWTRNYDGYYGLEGIVYNNNIYSFFNTYSPVYGQRSTLLETDSLGDDPCNRMASDNTPQDINAIVKSNYLFSIGGDSVLIDTLVTITIAPYAITTTSYCSFSSVKEYNDDDLINIYPNPFASEFIIDYKNPDVAEIIIYNSTGQEVLKSNFIALITLNTGILNKGFYILKIFSGNQIIHVEKVVKM